MKTAFSNHDFRNSPVGPAFSPVCFWLSGCRTLCIPKGGAPQPQLTLAPDSYAGWKLLPSPWHYHRLLL